jgi:hypothetical protein
MNDMNSEKDDEVQTRAPLAVWIPVSIILGLVALLVIGIVVLG